MNIIKIMSYPYPHLIHVFPLLLLVTDLFLKENVKKKENRRKHYWLKSHS